MVATAAREVADERLGRLAKRLGQAHVDGLQRRAETAERAEAAPDLSTAAGRLRAALDGTGRPGAPERRRVRPADWEGAANKDMARAVAVFLCDRGRPARSREIFARFHSPTAYALSEKAAHALVVVALEGSRIVMTGAEWWFEGEEKPRRIGGDSFEELFLEAAKETLCEAAGADLSAPEIEAAHGDAHLAVRKGFLADALRREGPAALRRHPDRSRKMGPPRLRRSRRTAGSRRSARPTAGCRPAAGADIRHPARRPRPAGAGSPARGGPCGPPRASRRAGTAP